MIPGLNEFINKLVQERAKDFTDDEKARLSIFLSEEALKTEFSKEEWVKFEPFLIELISFLQNKRNQLDSRIEELEAILG